MKKLTKRVNAGGLWVDVPRSTNWVCLDPYGWMVCFIGEGKPSSERGFSCWQGDEKVYGFMVELDGKDWRECCWYVGSQADGEAAERREWMAAGVDMVARAALRVNSGTESMNAVSQVVGKICAAVAEKIRGVNE